MGSFNGLAAGSVVAGVSAAGWLTVSLLLGWAGSRLPLPWLENDSALARLLGTGGNQRWYEQVLGIRRWKDRLPDAGRFFPGGFDKGTIQTAEPAVVRRFLAETRRAELVHLAIWPCWLITALWLPPGGVLIQLAAATLLNLPCLWVQRYNRSRLSRLLRRLETASLSSTPRPGIG